MFQFAIAFLSCFVSLVKGSGLKDITSSVMFFEMASLMAFFLLGNRCRHPLQQCQPRKIVDCFSKIGSLDLSRFLSLKEITTPLMFFEMTVCMTLVGNCCRHSLQQKPNVKDARLFLATSLHEILLWR